jgi:hypothetical protein
MRGIRGRETATWFSTVGFWFRLRSRGTAMSGAYFTALQALPGLALQPIVGGRYHDRFERRDGQWRFLERRVRTDLVGDVTGHLRRSTDDQ